MSSPTKTRLNVSATGSYVSMPSALAGADEGVKHVIKMAFQTRRPAEGERNDLEVVFSTDHVLVDLNSLDASALDVRKIIKDCEFVKEIAIRNPEKLKQMMQAYTASPTGFEKASDLADEIGLTEREAVKAGGGVAWLALLVIVALASKACEDAKKGNPQGKPKPAQ